MAVDAKKTNPSDPPMRKKGNLHQRDTWGDRKLDDDTAALRYRDPDNFPATDWRTHARQNFPETNEIPKRAERVRGEKDLGR